MLISVLTPSIRPEGLKIVQECLSEQTFQDFEWLVELGIPKKGNDLNQAYNRMLRRAKGELMVSYQDFIRIKQDGLERFWKAYQDRPDTFFTAPVGKVKNWDDEPRSDWRTFTENCMWNGWEIDWACAPLQALKSLGGFDEELDEHTWTFDNVNVGLRAEMAGFKFGCIPTNSARALDHDAFMEHPFRKKYSDTWHNMRLAEIRRGDFHIPPLT